MIASTKRVIVPGTGISEEVASETLHHLLIGGDQLTAERVRGAQNMRKNSTYAAGRLECLSVKTGMTRFAFCRYV